MKKESKRRVMAVTANEERIIRRYRRRKEVRFLIGQRIRKFQHKMLRKAVKICSKKITQQRMIGLMIILAGVLALKKTWSMEDCGEVNFSIFLFQLLGAAMLISKKYLFTDMNDDEWYY